MAHLRAKTARWVGIGAAGGQNGAHKNGNSAPEGWNEAIECKIGAVEDGLGGGARSWYSVWHRRLPCHPSIQNLFSLESLVSFFTRFDIAATHIFLLDVKWIIAYVIALLLSRLFYIETLGRGIFMMDIKVVKSCRRDWTLYSQGLLQVQLKHNYFVVCQRVKCIRIAWERLIRKCDILFQDKVWWLLLWPSG